MFAEQSGCLVLSVRVLAGVRGGAFRAGSSRSEATATAWWTRDGNLARRSRIDTNAQADSHLARTPGHAPGHRIGRPASRRPEAREFGRADAHIALRITSVLLEDAVAYEAMRT